MDNACKSIQYRSARKLALAYLIGTALGLCYISWRTPMQQDQDIQQFRSSQAKIQQAVTHLEKAQEAMAHSCNFDAESLDQLCRENLENIFRLAQSAKSVIKKERTLVIALRNIPSPIKNSFLDWCEMVNRHISTSVPKIPPKNFGTPRRAVPLYAQRLNLI